MRRHIAHGSHGRQLSRRIHANVGIPDEKIRVDATFDFSVALVQEDALHLDEDEVIEGGGVVVQEALHGHEVRENVDVRGLPGAATPTDGDGRQGGSRRHGSRSGRLPNSVIILRLHHVTRVVHSKSVVI